MLLSGLFLIALLGPGRVAIREALHAAEKVFDADDEAVRGYERVRSELSAAERTPRRAAGRQSAAASLLGRTGPALCCRPGAVGRC